MKRFSKVAASIALCSLASMAIAPTAGVSAHTLTSQAAQRGQHYNSGAPNNASYPSNIEVKNTSGPNGDSASREMNGGISREVDNSTRREADEGLMKEADTSVNMEMYTIMNRKADEASRRGVDNSMIREADEDLSSAANGRGNISRN